LENERFYYVVGFRVEMIKKEMSYLLKRIKEALVSSKSKAKRSR
jgi:hypothetical protein